MPLSVILPITILASSNAACHVLVVLIQNFTSERNTKFMAKASSRKRSYLYVSNCDEIVLLST
jgi:hypothetical protein